LRRNFFLKNIIEGKIWGIEVMGRQGRRRKQLLVDFKERENMGSWKRKHCITLWGTCFGRGYRMNEYVWVKNCIKSFLSLFCAYACHIFIHIALWISVNQ
jgi:hypothetical protein